MPDSPNLLVATEFSPNASGGGPAVVRQMLKDWPADKLHWWSCFPERDQRFGLQVASHHVAAIPGRLYPNQRWVGLKSWLMEYWWVPRAAFHLRHTIATVRPDVVWIIPHAWAIPPLAFALQRTTIGYHVTIQDYADVAGGVRRFGETRARRIAGLADHLYQHATTRDATSHPMIADLKTRTGAAAAQMLHAGLETSDFDWLRRPPAAVAKEIRIAYAGTIIVEPEFELFVRVLSSMRDQLPRPITLELFSAHDYSRRPWFNPEWMRSRGNLPEPALTAALRECAWGFAPMALSDGDPRYNRFSFPTKFISYLAAGLPVITLGHPESSVVQMAQAYAVGPCVTANDPTRLRAALEQNLRQSDAPKIFRAEILRCGQTEFDAPRMRQILRACFQQCATVTRSKGQPL